MDMIFYAHSGKNDDKSDWQLLKDHLLQVGNIAKLNASYFASGDLACLAGILHDLGKYTSQFQERLEGDSKKVDHATAGAQIAYKRWGKRGYLLAYSIAGHHAGLANGIDEGKQLSPLKERLYKNVFSLDPAWKAEINLPDFLPDLNLKLHSEPHFHGFQLSFLTRMIFSALVDADYIDTENFYYKIENKPTLRGECPNLKSLQEKLNLYLKQFEEESYNPHELVNSLRKKILDYACQQSSLEPGLFRMTVPTGGGKTLTSMAFALDHSIKYYKRRIIYVIPFTSIIEQNAKVFREAFGDLGETAILEHHSNFDDSNVKNEDAKDKLNIAMENWDMPIIVTTAVQFFESLFSNRTACCRKLHNISGSVIILDEAQILPLKLLHPIIAVIDELARNYACSIVLCSATQPALLAPDFKCGLKNVREIAPDPEELFKQLSLVNVIHLGNLTDNRLVEKIQQQKQTLVIVNNRRHAQSLFNSIKKSHPDGVFHLSTLMCAVHRMQILEKIKKRLKSNAICRVISTSLIEAGVDVDFPCVMRAEAGLDSIAQAAGRCNRERKRNKEDSPMWVFNSPEWKSPPELDMLSAGMRSIVRQYGDDLLSLDAMKAYFSEVYWRKGNELDAKGFMKLFHEHAPNFSFPFETIANDFRMIESILQPIIIPLNQEAQELIYSLHDTLQISAVLRKLQPYIVQIPKNAFVELQQARMIDVIAEHRLGTQFWQLINIDIYDEECGLSWDNPTFLKAESMVV